ncbi:MAG: DEAD/DEAH box helicase [Deltaproteobacteria bacterium]|nr:DEAD/DEAH box helicase [Deltaproteobacteria bacterium]
MSYQPDNPLIAQSDHTLLLETLSPRYAEARDALLAFAELIKSPEYVHTWRVTALSLWNAAAAGHTADEVVGDLERFAKYPIPANVLATVREKLSRYGRLRLVRDGEWLRLEADDPRDLAEIASLSATEGMFAEIPEVETAVRVKPSERGEVKRLLTSLGHPVADFAGYEDGDRVPLEMAHTEMRDYQVAAVDAFTTGPSAGSGVVVLPCGAGKTVVGIASMVRLGMRTLILCSGGLALQQWRREILARTTLREEDVAEYSGERKQLGPVTLTTYQLLTWRRSRTAVPAHFAIFSQANWGLVIYDEVHLLPAPIFRESAELQARRRLGLTATLIREDGLEGDVFALIGPKLFDLPWRQLEHQGWIAEARCVEVRIPATDDDRARALTVAQRDRYPIAARNPRKGVALERLLARHADEPILVLGTYLEQLHFFGRRFGFPVISGETPAKERERLYRAFRDGEIRVLGLSKVGNFAVDLPQAAVAIQLSGTFGSRQEEAQRLGRVLRPKANGNQAVFYTLVTADSAEQPFAERRQLFLTEQGYPYAIEPMTP